MFLFLKDFLLVKKLLVKEIYQSVIFEFKTSNFFFAVIDKKECFS